MSARPILILGVPRSGTRLVSRILGRIPGTILTTEHDNKSKIPEDHSGVSDSSVWRDAFDFKHGRASNGMPLCEAPIPTQEGENKIREHYALLAAAGRLIVKNPQHLTRIELIRRVLPDFQAVWVAREPSAILDSVVRASEQRFLLWKRTRASAMHSRRFQLRTDASLKIDPLDVAARVAHGLGFMVDRFKESPGHVVRYEKLVSAPKDEIAQLYGVVQAECPPDVAIDLPHKSEIKHATIEGFTGRAREDVERYISVFLGDEQHRLRDVERTSVMVKG